jgi:CRP/FNR family transcriptional regulator
MLSPHHHDASALPNGHPCRGCPVRENAICGVLTGDDLCTFRHLGCSVSLAKGESLFQEGEPALSVFTVTEGVLKSYRLLPDGRRQVTAFHYPGDCIGGTFDEEHGCTVEAVQDARVCAFPIRRFDEFVEDHPPMERELYIAAARQLAAAQTQMLLLGRKTAAERMASFFLALSERQGGSGNVGLPMSRSDIADHLGLTKETVSRVLADLKNDRLIRLLAIDQVQILDRARLKAIAAGGSA